MAQRPARSCYLRPAQPAWRAGTSGPGQAAWLPSPTHLLGAVCVAHLVVDVRNHLQRPAQRRQGLPAREADERGGSRQPGPAPPSLAARSPAGPVPAALRLGWSQQTWAEYQLSPFLTPLPLLLRASAFSPNKWGTTSVSQAAVRTQCDKAHPIAGIDWHAVGAQP